LMGRREPVTKLTMDRILNLESVESRVLDKWSVKLRRL
jgi:hypothetical protein